MIYSHKTARNARFQLLIDWLSTIPAPIRILDVGGLPRFWKEVPRGVRVHAINVKATTDPLPEGLSFELGDARDLSKWDTGEWDVVHCNSVIGHVGCKEEQSRAAAEIRRVAKRYFVQTPNLFFPIDWRTLVPGFHWLPMRTKAWLFCRVAVGRYQKVKTWNEAVQLASEYRDLTVRELRRMFPDGTLLHERIFGFSKSIIVRK